MSGGREEARAEAALRTRRWEEAKREAAALIAADPAGSTGHGMLSRAHLGCNEFAQARKAAEEGLARTPEREWLHRLRCHALRLEGDLAAALAAADECVRLAPGASESHAVRGKVLAALKHRDDAEEEYQRALQIDPHSADTHRDLGDLFLRKDPRRAEKHYRQALAIEPSDAVALNNFGAALLAQKRRDEAALAFKAAILADPTMQVAKRNAHATLSSRIGQVAGMGGAIYVGVQALRFAPVIDLHYAAMLLVLAVIASLAWRSYSQGKRERRLRTLKQTDPQLYELFTRLDEDKRAGRF